MKRFSLLPALLIACALCLTGCSSGASRLALPEGETANYMEQRSMLACGNGFVCQCDDMHYRLFAPDCVRYIDENAVEAVSQKFQYLFVSDGDSAVYGELIGAEHYGRGTGWRLYRWRPDSDRRKLIYKDTAVSGTDGFLGLEDVLKLDPLTVDHYLDDHAFFLINGDRAAPEYEIADILRSAAEENAIELKLPDSQLRIAVSGKTLFFADSLGALWRFDTANSGFTVLPYRSVFGFFVTADRLFVIPGPGEDIDVLDLYGDRMARIETGGTNLFQPLVFDGEDIYLTASGFEIVRIDGGLSLHRTGLIRLDNRWTVMDGVLYYFENGEILSAPIASDHE